MLFSKYVGISLRQPPRNRLARINALIITVVTEFTFIGVKWFSLPPIVHEESIFLHNFASQMFKQTFGCLQIWQVGNCNLV